MKQKMFGHERVRLGETAERRLRPRRRCLSGESNPLISRRLGAAASKSLNQITAENAAGCNFMSITAPPLPPSIFYSEHKQAKTETELTDPAGRRLN